MLGYNSVVPHQEVIAIPLVLSGYSESGVVSDNRSTWVCIIKTLLTSLFDRVRQRIPSGLALDSWSSVDKGVSQQKLEKWPLLHPVLNPATCVFWVRSVISEGHVGLVFEMTKPVAIVGLYVRLDAKADAKGPVVA